MKSQRVSVTTKSVFSTMCARSVNNKDALLDRWKERVYTLATGRTSLGIFQTSIKKTTTIIKKGYLLEALAAITH
jgi:hypothetical protein